MSKCCSADANCPFYMYDDNTTIITCEGLIGKSTITQRFPTKLKWKTHFDRFCCSNFRECALYKAIIDNKYKE